MHPVGRSEWLELPRHACALFAHYWPVLFFFFFAQRLAGWVLLPLSVDAGYLNHLLGILGLSFIVVVQLLCTVAMFDALRGGMGSLVVPGGVLPAPERHAGTRFGEMLAVVLLPFFAYYASWGLLRDSVRSYVLEFLRGTLDQQNGQALDLLSAKGVVISVVLTWALRRLLLWWQKRHRSALLSILATTCQAYWVFIGIMVISQWKNDAWDWVEHRVAWQWWLAATEHPILAGSAAVATGQGVIAQVGAFFASAIKTMLLPLVWFAIAAVVYGRNLKDVDALFNVDARLQHVRERYSNLVLPVRLAANHVIGKASSGWNSKGVPIINAVRMLNGGGLQLVLALCFYYVALGVVCEFAWRFVAGLIGPFDVFHWELFGRPLTVLFGSPMALEPSLLGEPLRICLLAAAVELAVQRTKAADAASSSVSDGGTAGSVAATAAG